MVAVKTDKDVLFIAKERRSKRMVMGCLVKFNGFCGIIERTIDGELVETHDQAYYDDELGCIDAYITPVDPSTIRVVLQGTKEEGIKIE